MKRLLIDINSIIPYYMNKHITGLGRTTYELVTALSQLEELPFELILYSQNMKGISPKGDIPLKNFHVYLPNRTIFKKAVNGLRIKRFATHYDLFHVPHNTDLCENMKKTIFTIHDLIVYRYPEMWNVTEDDKRYFRRVAKESKAIITCSESSRSDIIKFWKVQEEKVTAIPWGINRERFHPTEDKTILKSLGIALPFFFCASCNHPRKNTALLLDAYRRYLKAGGTKLLVILSPIGNELKECEDLVENHQVIITRNLSDTDLVSLYSHAHCTLMTSSYEGFGLPILESLACGTQVLSANNSSLPEVGGKVVDYFEELTSQCVCSHMLKVDGLEKHALLDPHRLHNHLDHYSWKNCAESYVSVYEKLLFHS